MFSFGSHPPRSLETFGISGLLRSDTEVFYNVLFTTRHIGRVSDLLSARLSKAKIDELKFRTTLVLGVFEAYRSQFQRSILRVFSKSDRDVLDEPLLLECGIDNEKLVLGVFFNLNESIPVQLENLATRIFNKESKDPFEILLVKLQEYSDRMVVKFQPKTRKMEIILLIALPGKIANSNQKQAPEILVFEKQDLSPAPRPKKYVNLGDLNYPQLLNEKVRNRKQLFSPTGEFLMPGESTSNEEKLVVSTDSNFVASVSPDGLIGESKHRREEIEVLQVQGSGAEDLANQDVVVVSEQGTSKKKSRWGVGRIASLFRKTLSAFRRRKVSSNAPEEEDELSVIQSDPALEDVSEEVIQEAGQALPNVEPLATDGLANDEELELLSSSSKGGDPELESKNLAAELRAGGLERVIRGMQREMATISQGTQSARTRMWIESQVALLTSERSKLTEITRKVNLSVRLKSLELNKELTGLKEEMKRKETLLNQKSKALARSQEALAEANRNMESVKSQNSGAEGNQFKQKFQLTQRMLVISKEENSILSKRVEELKAQVAVAQGGRGGSSDTAEYTELREKYDRLYRQAEEFKKTNRQLMDHLKDPKKDRNETMDEAEEKKRRFEAAMRLVATSRKETTEAKEQITEYKNREAVLKTEVLKLQTQLKRLANEKKAELEKKSSDDGKNGPATPKAA